MLTSQINGPSPADEARSVMERLPASDYARNYQPAYPDQAALFDALHDLQNVNTVTKRKHVDDLREALAQIALDEVAMPIFVVGNCTEEVGPQKTAAEIAGEVLTGRQAILDVAPDSLVVARNRGQSAKPRSKPLEELPDRQVVPPFMGGAINGLKPTDRIPNPDRMVKAAMEAYSLEQALTEINGAHLPAAHEALLLAYEESFVVGDGRQNYLLSADFPWIGLRTNQPDGDHVRLLSGVVNPRGAKIGPNSTAEHIAALKDRLDPDGTPGKLSLMLRLGPQNHSARTRILEAVKAAAPNALIIYDMHGATRIEDGLKIRCVSEIIDEIKLTAKACGAAGLKLHGLHLETMDDDSRLECVDQPDQSPTHFAVIDPQLNPRQTRTVIQETVDFLL